MATLTYEDIQFAFNRLQMVGNQDLPMKVSYALTRTKNKYLKPEVESFQEETEGIEDDEEMKNHRDQEVEVEVHNVSANHLDGVGIPPQMFLGLTFVFPEAANLDTRQEEFKNREVVQILNVLYNWSERAFQSWEGLLSVSKAMTELRPDIAEIEQQLNEINSEIRDAEKNEDPDEEKIQSLKEKRDDFLEETSEITVTSIDLDTIVDKEEDLSVSPNAIEALDPFVA